MKAPLALIFDLDGTLVDSRLDIAAACNHALVAMGRAPLPVARIASFVGDGARMLLARAFEKSESDVDAELAVFRAYYAEHACDETRLVSGARELLDEMGPRLPLSICTNKPRDATLAVLRGLGVADAFRATYCGGDGPLKPDPHGVREMCRASNVPPSDAWMIGDGPQDILAAKSAGAIAIGVVSAGIADESALRAAGPDHVFASLTEVLASLTDRPA